MDIRCPICGEPWDIDSLHEEVENRYPDKPWVCKGNYNQEEYETYYKPIVAEFRKKGCETFGCSHGCIDMKAARLSEMLFDILGEDIDGIASELDDAEFLGII